MSFGGRCLKMSEMNMKVKEMKEILNKYPDEADLYLLLENGYGKTSRHSIDCNKVVRHYLNAVLCEVHVWLGWRESDDNE